MLKDGINIMNLELWDKIEFHYNQATKYLWIQRNDPNWHKDTEKGLWNLLTAYNMTIESEEKKHLLYARILIMLYEEFKSLYYSEKELFTKYVKPALEEYNLSRIEDKKEPTEKELNKAKQYYEHLKYLLGSIDENREASYENFISLIDNNELLKDFNFYDSMLLSFEFDKDSAILTLDYYGLVRSFKFDNIYKIEIDTDPVSDHINTFCCQRELYFENRIVVDIGFYKIVCEKISVIG